MPAHYFAASAAIASDIGVIPLRLERTEKRNNDTAYEHDCRTDRSIGAGGRRVVDKPLFFFIIIILLSIIISILTYVFARFLTARVL